MSLEYVMNSWIGCWLWFLVFLVVVLKGHDPTIKMNLKNNLCLHHDFEMWFQDLLATRSRQSVDVLGDHCFNLASWWVYVGT